MRNARITASDILLMEQLRAQGYSNMQIAHDMGLDNKTVWKHIGPQGKGIRAEYGSYKTHCSGEPYCKEAVISDMKIDLPKMDLKPEDWNGPITTDTIVGDIHPIMESVTTSAESIANHTINVNPKNYVTLAGYTANYHGKEFTYTIDNWPDGRTDIVITKMGSGSSISIKSEDLEDFIYELMDLEQKIPKLAD